MAFHRASCHSQKRIDSALEVLKACFIFFTSLIEGNSASYRQKETVSEHTFSDSDKSCLSITLVYWPALSW